jgi:hypothetical protein
MINRRLLPARCLPGPGQAPSSIGRKTSSWGFAPSGSLAPRSKSMGSMKRALVSDEAIGPQISGARERLKAAGDL